MSRDTVGFGAGEQCRGTSPGEGAGPLRGGADFRGMKKAPGRRAMHNDPGANVELALVADGVPLDQAYPVDLGVTFEKHDESKPFTPVSWGSGTQLLQGRGHGREADGRCREQPPHPAGAIRA